MLREDDPQVNQAEYCPYMVVSMIFWIDFMMADSYDSELLRQAQWS